MVVKSTVGHTSQVVATGRAKIKRRGLHTVTFDMTSEGMALARSASGKVKLRFLITDHVHHVKLESARSLKAALS